MPVALILLGALIGALGTALLHRRHGRLGASRHDAERRELDVAVARAHAAEADVHRLRVALDALDVGVMLADGRGRVVLRNASVERVAGSRYGEVLLIEHVDQMLDESGPGGGVQRLVHFEGPPARTLALHVVPLAGELAGSIVTISDITERTRLDAVRTDFVANISHELKTPVGAMSLLAETLADVDDEATVKRLAGKVVLESTRLARTIDDLLELSRIELGGEPVCESVPLRRVVDDSVERVGRIAELRRVRLSIDPGVSRVKVAGDRRQLVSALANLLDNAVKYSAEGQTVEVAVDAGSRWVDIAVSDHGIGIGPQHLERIFERFYRVDRARSRDTGGTGLGLAIVRHVAVNHGGEVMVKSEEGVGSTFTLRIPAVPAVARAADPPADAPADPPGLAPVRIPDRRAGAR